MATVTVQTREDAVKLFREMGLIGAGGAGFPTYFKYLTPTKILIVNAEEGEPGYEADKILLISKAEAFVEIFAALKKIFGFEQIFIGAKEKDKKLLEPLREKYGFDIRYTPSIYGMGEEKWLTKAVTGMEVPPGKIPLHVGVTVNNVETVYNMYRAIFQGQPVTEKYLNVYGEVAKQTVVLAPVGTYLIDILAMIGVDTTRYNKLAVLDGGPLMGDRVNVGEHAVTKKTNGFLVIEAAKYVADQVSLRPLPGQPAPTWDDTLPEAMKKLGLERYLDWHPTPADVLDIRDKVTRVKIFMHQDGPRGKPSIPIVKVGDRVKVGDPIAKPLDGPINDFNLLSVAHHASIDGVVTEVTEKFVRIEKK
jgi:Na+-translocating ferredoxin:NAD+ oxidoreductase RnfC subunit